MALAISRMEFRSLMRTRSSSTFSSTTVRRRHLLTTISPGLGKYLQYTDIAHAGFHYHLISVFGSQSTGKSTLLNALFNTDFNVMSEAERKQTTKGIWLSKNKSAAKMAENILVMDVEGTDGRERGEDQDFERKSSLFALATSEVLMVNIWEHQVGLYQGANMGLLKTVFEVNLELFLKDKKSTSRSLLYFVIRDFLGTTPLQNLRNTFDAGSGQDMVELVEATGSRKEQHRWTTSISLSQPCLINCISPINSTKKLLRCQRDSEKVIVTLGGIR